MEQQRIWDHFQTVREDGFRHGAGRYPAMAALARRCLGHDGGRVLNIGIGAAGVERLLQARGWQVAALDPGERAAAALAAEGVDARCGQAERMPFEDARFDVVVASEVLEHIEPAPRAAALAEVARVLVPGGWFIGSVPCREVLADAEVVCPCCGQVFHRWGHVSSFDVPTLAAELSPHFEAVHARPCAFVDWAAARAGAGALAKGLARALLGRLGEPIASPSIVFRARRTAG